MSKEIYVLFDELNEKPIAFHRSYAKITGSVTAGLLLSQLLYWNKAMKNKRFYKTDQDFCDELGMGLYEFKSAQKRLVELRFIKTERKGVPAKTYYLVDIDEVISAITSYGKNPELELGKTQNSTLEKPITITENTQENNSEINFSKEKLKDNSVTKDRVSGNTTLRESIKKEEYEVVPVNAEGDEVSPLKRVDRSKELAIEQLFIDECVKRGLTKPVKVPVYYLDRVKKGMLSVSADELPVFFDWWFQNGFPDSLLNVHSAFSTAAINQFRGRSVVLKKSDPKYSAKVNKIKI